MAFKVYSLGYEKKTINEFIKILEEVKVSILLDVREFAWSYKQDFRKKSLNSALAKVGIDYYHISNAGNPKKIRKKYSKPSTVLSKYSEYLNKTESGIIEIKTMIRTAKRESKNICLICYEQDFYSCHRSILLSKIKKSMPRLAVKHL